jgi:hypothetical protein
MRRRSLPRSRPGPVGAPGLWLVCAALALSASSWSLAQDSGVETSGASDDVEESDEEYRRRMELEDARQRNLGYTLPPESYAAQQDKLDKLPEESRDNIRDQLVDMIVEEGEWEPGDALKDYPYEPTAAALDDQVLLEQEQAAWDEQIEKYHKREAAAFGTYLGPVPGPGNPDGAEGGAQAGADGSQEGSGSAGAPPGTGAAGVGETQEGGQGGSAGQAGTYEPYQSNRDRSDEEEVSTAGAQQSALDFLRALQGEGQPQAAPAGGAVLPEPTSPDASDGAAPPAAVQAAQQSADAPDQPAEEGESVSEAVETELTMPGIIAIEDLDKLEGADSQNGADGR